MTICVRQIEARVVDFPVRTEGAIVSSLGRHTSSRYVVVTVRDESGVRGYAEATTAPIWSGESAETARWIIDSILSPLVVNAHLDHPSEAVALFDRTLHGNSFGKAAVDIALWDLWARKQNKSVSSLIADREPAKSVPTRVSIGAYPPDETVRLAVEFWDAGVRTLKFKTGVPGIDDVARLLRCASDLGRSLYLRLMRMAPMQRQMRPSPQSKALAPFNLAVAEQPTRRDRLSVLAEVRRRTSVPIMADEAVFTVDELREALDLDAIDILSVYPGKNGGFTHSLAMAKLAQEAGKPCAIGSNLETDLGQAPHVCLAASLSAFPVEKLACDLMGSLFYATSAVTPPIALKSGRVELPTGPGFGVTPNV